MSIGSILEIDGDRMAPILGATPADICGWMMNGVPVEAQASVQRAFATAVALRRVVSAPVARRLLERRAQRESLDREVASLGPALQQLPLKRLFIRIRD
jgi:hypothetical protein